MPLVSDPKTRRDGATAGLPREDMPFLHHCPDERPKPKFKGTRKRANILLDEITREAIEKNKKEKPEVFDVPFEVGDAIELLMVDQGGVNSEQFEKVRGVVIGIKTRGLASCVMIRDVVFGSVIERGIMLHSPLLKSITILEKNFVYKGKRKVKRAKLYFLRKRKDEDSKVTKW